MLYNGYKRHYIMVSAFALSMLVMALIFLFVHAIILREE